MASHPDRAGGGEGTDEMEWNPEWDQDEEDGGAEDDEADEEEQMMLRDAASSQTVDPELMQGSEKFFVNLTTTSNLMTLKGSLASILSVAGNTELYGDLIRKLEQAVPEEDREDFAALMIQRNYRRISQQRKARAERERRRLESVEKLQSVYRGHLARRYVLLRHLAAARMQGLGRGYITRKRLFKEKMLRNSTRIQRWFRACMARDLMTRMRREGGAVALQRVYRGHLGRVLFTFRRETLAATSVQRCVRGHNGRISARVEIEKLAVAKQKRMVRAAIMFQGLYRAHKCRRWIARRRAALNLARCIRMANRVQRTFRGYRGRVRYRVLLHLQRIDAYAVAITPIQALGRGHIVRQRMRDEAARLADIELKRLRASLMLFGQTRAARIIQKDYRRWTVRKFEWAVNHAASSIQLWYRLRRMGAQGRAARQRIYNKATKLQFVVRGHLTRNLVRELRRQAYATRLQATFRGHIGRRHARDRRDQVHKLALKEEAARQAALAAHRQHMAVLAQSNRGMVEVFTQQPSRKDPSSRPPQIVPGYLHKLAVEAARVARPDASADKTILDAPDLGRLLAEEVHVQTGAVRSQSDAFGWDSLDPELDPFAAGGVDDDYYVGKSAPAGKGVPGTGYVTETHASSTGGVPIAEAGGRLGGMPRHVTWGGERAATGVEDDERGGGEEHDGWGWAEGDGEQGEGAEGGWVLRDDRLGKVSGHGEIREKRQSSSKSKVRFEQAHMQQIAPAYLLPRAVGGVSVDDTMLGVRGGRQAVREREERALGLGASLPAAMWQQLRRGGMGSVSPTRGEGPSPARQRSTSVTPYLDQHHSPLHQDQMRAERSARMDTRETSATHTPHTSYTQTASRATSVTHNGVATPSEWTTGPSTSHNIRSHGVRSGFSYSGELGWGAGGRDIHQLLPSEVANLQRLARLDAKYFQGGEVGEGARSSAPQVSLATAQVYAQDMVQSKSVRKRFRLDHAHAMALERLGKGPSLS